MDSSNNEKLMLQNNIIISEIKNENENENKKEKIENKNQKK